MNTIIAKHSKLASKTPSTMAQLFYIWMLCILTIGLAQAANQSEDTAIAILLQKAEKAFANNRLTTPAHDNAMRYIDQVLQQKPNDPQARALLNKIVERYARWVDNTTLRASSAARYLHFAKRFRERAQHVTQSHALPLAPIERMDEKILPVQRKLGSETRNHDYFSVDNLLDYHLRRGNDAFAAQDLAESAWHARQARSLVKHYHLDAAPVAALEQRLRTKGELNPLPANAEPRKPKYQQLRTELSACHIETALAYLELGNLKKAEKHQRAAKSIIEEERLNNAKLLRLTQQIEQRRTALNRPYYFTDHRLFGNF